MKSYRSVVAVALGLFFAFSVVGSGVHADSHIMCPSCRSAIPSSTKPVVEMVGKMDTQCSICGSEIKAESSRSVMWCPSCKAQMTLCGICSKIHEGAMAKPS